MPGRKSPPLLMYAITGFMCWSAGYAYAAPEASAGVAAAKPAASIVVSPAQSLVPHKALYEVRLTSTKNGSQMVNISGKMYYEWKPSCEGWITNHRFSLDYEYADSPSLNISSDFSTFETFDGKNLNFSSRRKRDGEIYEELRGKANMLGANGTGKAEYSIPEGLAFDLAKGTLFPTQHTINLLAQARQGKKFFNVQIFDGSDDDGPVDINSFIGPKIAAVASPLKKESGFKPSGADPIDESLINTPYWNVRMAFFPTKTDEASSDYELSMVFHENGIISDMLIEYSDFSVRQKLVALEKVAPEKCKN